MEMMHRVRRDAAEQVERLIPWILLDDPMPVTSDILERTRHWNSLKSMVEKIVLQTVVLTARWQKNPGEDFIPLPDFLVLPMQLMDNFYTFSGGTNLYSTWIIFLMYIGCRGSGSSFFRRRQIVFSTVLEPKYRFESQAEA